MNKIHVLLMIGIAYCTLYGQVNDGSEPDAQGSLNLLRSKISSYEQYYNKMVRLADEGPNGMSMQSLYQIDCRPLGRPFLLSEIEASKKESPQALKLFKKANGCNVSSNILLYSGAIIAPVGLMMMIVAVFSDDPRRFLGTGLTLSAVGLTATLISLPISTSGIRAKRKGYLQYDKDLRHTYHVPNSVVIEDE